MAWGPLWVGGSSCGTLLFFTSALSETFPMPSNRQRHGPLPAILNPLFRHCFDGSPHNSVTSQWLPFAMQHGNIRVHDKRFHWANFSIPTSLSPRAKFAPVNKESHNGLEDTQDRRSAGRHGNQHVCVRRPQVSGREAFTL